MELSELKQRYELIAKKYSLANFKKMNEEFEIDRITIESDCLVRSVRKVMMEKVVGWLRFFEMLLNPASAPRLYMPYLRSMTIEDKQDIEYIYSSLGAINLSALHLESEYSEKAEAEMVKKIFDKMNSLKPLIKKIIEHIEQPKSEMKKEKNYFG